MSALAGAHAGAPEPWVTTDGVAVSSAPTIRGATPRCQVPFTAQGDCPTFLIAAGHHIKVVQEILGLSFITIAAESYTSVPPEPARRSVEDVAALIPIESIASSA